MAGTVFNLTHDADKIGRALAQAEDVAVTEIDKALGRGAIEVAREMSRQAPKYRSELANSIMAERVGLLLHMVRARGKAYGPYVNDGTGPGGVMPMAEALNWVQRKGITPRTPGMSQRSLAALIRHSIVKKGIKANPFADRTLQAMLPRLDALLDAAADKALATVAKS